MTTLDPDRPVADRAPASAPAAVPSARPAPPPALQAPRDLVALVRQHTRQAAARVALRLVQAVAPTLPAHDPTQATLQAAQDLAQALLDQPASPSCPSSPDNPALPAFHPLAQLDAFCPFAARPGLVQDLLLLACLPLLHEGFGALCRALHPQAQPWPTPALALCWLEAEAQAPTAPTSPTAAATAVLPLREQLEDWLAGHGAPWLAPAASASPVALGLLRLQADGHGAAEAGQADDATPWQARSLRPGPGVWEALMARAPRLPHAALVAGHAPVPGLDAWLDSPPVRQAALALRRRLPCQLLVLGGDAAMRASRVRALLGLAHAAALRLPLDGAESAATSATSTTTFTATAASLRGAALLQQAALWLESSAAEEDGPSSGWPQAGTSSPWPAADLPLTLITSAASERQLPTLGLPQLRLEVRPLPPAARRALWQALLPQLGDDAGLLAARYPIEPEDARAVLHDLRLRQALAPDADADADTAPALHQLSEGIRARTPWRARPGVQRVQPQAGWAELLLPDKPRRQLQAAVRRVLQQITVLDDWGFAQGRSERRGVRLLFHGLPGTGKTLAAEVMARELGVDLLVVDLASLVSKWIGETEKNLAAVFDMAERSRALLLFDEADALFARRTDTQDAHDRYANLETAYLLQRLERFESLAVLTTNLRANLDPAFARRFEFIVEFPEPDASARERLWRLHLPATAPLDADVDLPELAAWYALSGAQIKNAALAAAFLAAAQGRRIHQRHFLLAIEREYDKAGRAHPGFPPHAAGALDDAPTA